MSTFIERLEGDELEVCNTVLTLLKDEVFAATCRKLNSGSRASYQWVNLFSIDENTDTPQLHITFTVSEYKLKEDPSSFEHDVDDFGTLSIEYMPFSIMLSLRSYARHDELLALAHRRAWEYEKRKRDSEEEERLRIRREAMERLRRGVSAYYKAPPTAVPNTRKITVET